MRQDLPCLRTVLILSCVGSFLPITMLAQADRIGGSIDVLRMVPLRGIVHPLARPPLDEGAVDPSMKLNYITLMALAGAVCARITAWILAPCDAVNKTGRRSQLQRNGSPAWISNHELDRFVKSHNLLILQSR